MAKSKAEVNFMEHLKPLLPAGGDASELEAAAQALAGLSPEDRDLLAAVQESPLDRKSTRLNSSHNVIYRMPSSA